MPLFSFLQTFSLSCYCWYFSFFSDFCCSITFAIPFVDAEFLLIAIALRYLSLLHYVARCCYIMLPVLLASCRSSFSFCLLLFQRCCCDFCCCFSPVDVRTNTFLLLLLLLYHQFTTKLLSLVDCCQIMGKAFSPFLPFYHSVFYEKNIAIKIYFIKKKYIDIYIYIIYYFSWIMKCESTWTSTHPLLVHSTLMNIKLYVHQYQESTCHIQLVDVC